jgi:uncharacterized protein (DUF1501 family)
MRPPAPTALSRRDLLRTAMAAGVGMLLPGALQAYTVPTSPATPTSRRLVLVELEGGNDGLNTVVPLAAGAQYWQTYYDKRPTLRYPVGSLVPLKTADSGAGTLITDGFTGFGLNPALVDLKAAWYGQDLAIALGVGYDKPNRSHFRGIDIVHSAQDGNSTSPAATNWMSDLFALGGNAGLVGGLKGHGIVLDHYASTPLRGGGAKELAVQTAQRFAEQAAGVTAITAAPGSNDALAFLKTTIANIISGRDELTKAKRPPGVPAGSTPGLSEAEYNQARWDEYWSSRGITWSASKSVFVERQCRAVAELIVSGVQVPVFRITLGGFDTHSAQKNVDSHGEDVGRHATLMAQLGVGLSRLRTALMGVNVDGDTTCWDDTLVMTYSEFGRRVEQNGSGGTDHGTAAPHLILGGSIQGQRFFGTQPVLNVLDHGDQIATLDYRALYYRACNWLGLAPPACISTSGIIAQADAKLPLASFFA